MGWYGHVERMSEERLMKQIYRAEVDRTRGSGKPRPIWRDNVGKVLGERSMTILRDACKIEKGVGVYGR